MTLLVLNQLKALISELELRVESLILDGHRLDVLDASDECSFLGLRLEQHGSGRR